MGLETATYINGLVVSNPAGGDDRSQGDDHIRLVKSAIKNTFPNLDGAMTLTEEVINALPTTKANLASPALTGVPTAPTAAPGTNTTQLATTAFVAALGALKANIASPTFTGIPSGPTASPGANTTQLATTAFVSAAVAVGGGGSPSSDGYVVLAGGIRLQWGKVLNPNQTGSVTFPAAFPSTCASLQLTHNNVGTTARYAPTFTAISATGFDWKLPSEVNITDMRWMAVGY